MNKSPETIGVSSKNGLYRIYLFADKNPLPSLEIYKLANEVETPVKNMYGELKN